MKALALDFDGVLVDSVREVFAVAVATWAELEPRSTLARELVGEAGVTPWEGLPRGRRSAFARLIPLGNRAEDFGVALAALDRGLDLADQASYDAFFATFDPAWCAAYHECFYRQRAALRGHDLGAWLDLHRAYPSFVEVLERRRDEVALAIATSKDRHSVRLLLDHLGVGHLFADDLLLDKETGADKARHVGAIAHRLGLAASAITFVDDKVRHLEAVDPTGARTVLAAWGHTTAAERARAVSLGFPVATLDDAESILFDRHPREDSW